MEEFVADVAVEDGPAPAAVPARARAEPIVASPDIGIPDPASTVAVLLGRARREWIFLALLVTFATHALPYWIYWQTYPYLPVAWQHGAPAKALFDYRDYFD